MPTESGLDRLTALLADARRHADQTARVRRRLLGKRADRSVSEDYADRLAEKAKFRELLTDERLDGMRFRWYFSKIENGLSLEQLRVWIDGKIAKEDERAA